MLDNHQFTLLILAVGLGALLVSFNAAYHNEIDVLTAELEGLHGEAGQTEGGVPEARGTRTKQIAEIGQRLESVALCLRHSIISALLLLSFTILLAFRIFLWAWQTPSDALQRTTSGRLFWFDRLIVSILVVLLLQVCISHLLLGVPLFLAAN